MLASTVWPSNVTLATLTGTAVAAARVLGPLGTVGLDGGPGLLALVATNARALLPGVGLVARLATGGEEEGFVLPASAVVRSAGQPWVYELDEPESFHRRAVTLDRPSPDGWLVTGDWPRSVVTSGAQSLLSEELKHGILMKD